MKPFYVPSDLLINMASGPADPKSLALLKAGQISKHLQLATFAVRESKNDDAARVISEVQRTAPAVADLLLGSPWLGSWGATFVRQIKAGRKTDPSYLSATAVAGAMWACLDADLTLYVREGMILVPTFGAARVDAAEHSPVRANVVQGHVTLTLEGHEVELPADLRHETRTWLPARSIGAEAKGLAISVTVEDLDYNRDCYGKTVAGRQTAEEIEGLSDLLQGAWELLTEHACDRACELSKGIRSLVPLSPVDAGPGLSATSATAYGALGLTIPDRPEHLAATLVHEFQHSKLSAFLDLQPLYDKENTERFFAPWKPEPRPIGGLLQGGYAFLAVAEFWARLYQAGFGRSSERHFADIRLQVSEVLSTLATITAFNDDGRRFISGMQEVMSGLLAIEVSSAAEATARRKLAEATARWQERNASLPR